MDDEMTEDEIRWTNLLTSHIDEYNSNLTTDQSTALKQWARDFDHYQVNVNLGIIVPKK